MVATTTITATESTRQESSTSTARTTSTSYATAQNSRSFRKPTLREQRKAQEERQRAAPAKYYSVNGRHLDEFTSRFDLFLRRKQHAAAAAATMGDATTVGSSPISPKITKTPTEPVPPKPHPLKEPLSIKPMMFANFLSDGLHLYLSHVLHPSQIPGNDIFSRVYAMGVLPVLIVVLTLVQGGIGLLVILVNYTRIGARFYSRFFDDQIALFDDTDFVDPDGTNEAIRQLADRQPRDHPRFSYHIANLLLIMSSMSYQRNDKLVARASKILLNVKNEPQRAEAARLLQESEKTIDEDAQREFGMRFMGISELKTLGGPYAGLFYNDNAIVLVFKGTSVLAFNEYLIDVTIQRVDASEYLYGEVHKGFYESLFPDAKPVDWYESTTYDQTNPFNTIMHSIFEIAKISKHKTGKPVNLWLTGHSLGGALVALVMARLQMPIQESDPLNQDENGNYPEKTPSTAAANPNGSRRPRTVLEEMLARFSDDPDLLVLRDAYSQASPKIGDSTFAEEFATNHVHYCKESPYKTTYWRMAADKDVVPRLPPGCSVDPSEPCDRPYPYLSSAKRNNWLRGEPVDKREKVSMLQHQNSSNHSAHVGGYPNNDVVGQHANPPRKHLNSLLDYQHVGQLVQINHAATSPVAKPSVFEADLCHGVLRKQGDVKKLLTNIGRLANVLESETGTKSNGSSSKKTVTHFSTTTSITTTSSKETRATTRSNTDNPVIIEATAKQVAEDIAQANALFDVDELSRLRQPRLLERILLSFPSLMSHAPVTYQRNLVRARFYFKSFPGTHFEERVGKWIEQGDEYQDRVDVDVEVKVDMTQSSSTNVQARTQTKTTVAASEHLWPLKREE
ncbi:hypothetical protein EMPS_02055 [Entomortierella parvispora]|uniref:Fungal lipase-type domain-containing protein n=1 Tax=Entomortierella parvispora TaxID=205924 RepID=A0A9P3H4Q1_9FUNG|nr:hypothetical protein EMPS_02055 [Entomortierella parvispora]